MTTFYLGTHRPTWLGDARLGGIPLFVSRSTLAGKAGRLITQRRSLPRAQTRWALDSGGFTALQNHGRWTITAQQYVSEVRRCAEEIGGLDWAAPMDWMCEPVVISGGRVGPIAFAGTGLDVAEHQRRTVGNYLELRALAPDLPFVPVLQGYTLAEYQRCVELYTDAGIDLAAERVVGLGSVCRRQATSEIQHITTALHLDGLRNLHGFGVKTDGLALYGPYLSTADSQAWSKLGRHVRPGCTSTHDSEANCLRYALTWRDSVLRILDGPAQLDLFGGAA